MTNASKVKGNSGERELCKYMIKVFGGSWVRVPNSGGMVGGLRNVRAKTLSKSQLLNQSNDIVPPDEYPNCALEVKFYKDFSFNMLMDPKGYQQLNEWIDQVNESGIDMEKSFPMICFKINNKGWHTVVWSEKIKKLKLNDINYTVYNYKGVEFKIFEMKTFMERYTEELKKFFK
jgi:Holliday junction resolvase